MPIPLRQTYWPTNLGCRGCRNTSVKPARKSCEEKGASSDPEKMNKLTTKQKTSFFKFFLIFQVTDLYHIRITIPDRSRLGRSRYGTSIYSQI